jgi:hypothetical protein
MSWDGPSAPPHRLTQGDETESGSISAEPTTSVIPVASGVRESTVGVRRDRRRRVTRQLDYPAAAALCQWATARDNAPDPQMLAPPDPRRHICPPGDTGFSVSAGGRSLTDESTVFRIADNRGADVARSILGTGWEKVVMSGQFPGYDWIARRQHCWSHLRRDFRRGSIAVTRGRRSVRSCSRPRTVCSTGGTNTWWHKHRDGAMAWSTFLGYIRQLQWAVRQALGRGASRDSGKTAATCRELLAGEDHLWAFVRMRGIAPTNNAEDRALRHAVLWRKSSGGTASGWGSRLVELILSVVATCRQRSTLLPGSSVGPPASSLAAEGSSANGAA